MKKLFCVIALAGFCFVGCAPEATTTPPASTGADTMPATAPATDTKPADAPATDAATPPAEAPK